MEMGAHGADGETQDFGDLEVGALLLVIEDEDGPLDGAEMVKLLFDEQLQLALLKILVRVEPGMREPVFPGRAGFFFAAEGGGEGNGAAIDALAALPFVLGDVEGDAVEVGGDERFSSEGGQRAEQAQEDVLGLVFEIVRASGEASEGAKDHLLMVVDDLLELGVGGQGGEWRVRPRGCG